MKNTLLFQVWESLSAVEIRRLDKFLKSPYHNKHKGVLRLFEFLKKHGDLSEEEMTRERVFAFVFPKEAYEDLKLRHVMSYMLKALETFCILENKNLEREGDFLLLDTYHEKDLESPFLTKWNAVAKGIDSGKTRNEAYHFSRLRLNDYGFRQDAEGKNGDEAYLQVLSDELDSWFLIKKLRAGSAMLLKEAQTGEKLSNGLLDAIIITAKIMGLLKPTEIAVHFYAFQCLNEPDDLDHFGQLKNILDAAAPLIGQEELAEVLEIGIHFCREKQLAGEDKFQYEAFKLYRKGIDLGAYVVDGKIAPEKLAEVVTAAIEANEAAWAAGILENFENKIGGGFSRSHYLKEKSRILFAQGQYSEVDELLDKIFIKHFPARLEAEIKLMQSLYENGENKRLEKLIGNFLRSLHRKETPADRKKDYRNFGQSLKKLVKFSDDDGKMQELRATLAVEMYIAEQDWLLDKINDTF